MENDTLHAQIDMAGQNSFVLDGIPSQTIPNGLVLPDSLDLNHQNQTLAGYPVLSALQGEPVSNPPYDPRVTNRAGIFDAGAFVASLGRNLGSTQSICSMEFQEQSIGGTTVSSNPLSTLLAASSKNLNNLAISAPSVYPVGVLRNYTHNDLNSSSAGDVNCSGDVLGNMSKFHAQPESVRKTLARTEFQSYPSLGNVDSNGWMPANGAIVSMDYPYGSPKHTNELSLSLASCQPSVISASNARDQCSEISCSGVTRHYFNEPGFGTEQTSSNRKELSLSFVSYRSAQPSQAILGSRYLHVIQEILAQVASYSLENLDLNTYSTHMTQMRANVSLASSCSGETERGTSFIGYDEFLDVDGRSEDQADRALHRQTLEAKKAQLLTLLEVVDNQYNQCLDEIHTVVSAFHAATELDPQIHTRFALQTVSFLYKNLRERISNQILALGAHFNSECAREKERSPESSFIQKQWALQQLKRKDQLWRPQRGLPERSVSVLRAWMFQNFLHPYPKDAEKHLLAVKSGLTRSQVSNWFINARVRLWKPMIEEMYAEMNRRKAWRNEEGNNNNHRSHNSIDSQRFNVNGS